MRRFILLLPVLTFGQFAPEVTTNVQLENMVFYLDQHGDATKIATLPGLTPVDPQLGGALRRYLIIADVSSVGGKPSAGTFLAHGLALNASSAPEPVPGRPIADLPRNQMHHMVLEIMTPEKVQVGGLYGFWLGAGSSPPGAPLGAGVLAVLGGSGAFVGVRGQGTNVGASNLRAASMMEDPAFRRVNGGGRLTLGLQLSGAMLAEVLAAWHADFTLVPPARPARSGEVLVLEVKAGWPVQSPLEAEKVFSGEPLQEVAIPVEAMVNDVSAEIVNVVGWPGTRDRYRVDVRLPGGFAPGMAKLQLNGAYLPGAPFDIPVQ